MSIIFIIIHEKKEKSTIFITVMKIVGQEKTIPREDIKTGGLFRK